MKLAECPLEHLWRCGFLEASHGPRSVEPGSEGGKRRAGAIVEQRGAMNKELGAVIAVRGAVREERGATTEERGGAGPTPTRGPFLRSLGQVYLSSPPRPCPSGASRASRGLAASAVEEGETEIETMQ